jgi:hypothetical protein
VQDPYLIEAVPSLSEVILQSGSEAIQGGPSRTHSDPRKETSEWLEEAVAIAQQEQGAT